jgi:hypothetical protein
MDRFEDASILRMHGVDVRETMQEGGGLKGLNAIALQGNRI